LGLVHLLSVDPIISMFTDQVDDGAFRWMP